MKILRFVAAQGDLGIFEVDELPSGLTEKQAENGKHVLAHSETGHHHVVDGNTVRVFEVDEFQGYMDVKEDTNVVHLRSFDTHAPIALKGDTKYKIIRERERTPDGYRRAAD